MAAWVTGRVAEAKAAVEDGVAQGATVVVLRAAAETEVAVSVEGLKGLVARVAVAKEVVAMVAVKPGVVETAVEETAEVGRVVAMAAEARALACLAATVTGAVR